MPKSKVQSKIEKRREIVQSFEGAKSVCSCGHSGDGGGGQHAGFIGHGACTARGCHCMKFTWAEYLPELQRKLDAVT